MEKKPIRILHVIGIMNRGGAENMIMNFYRNIDREKIQFDFVENSYEIAAFDEEILSLGGRIYRCPHYNGKNHFHYVSWWKTFFKEHENVYVAVHGHLGSTAAIYLSIAKNAGIYTIAHSHNINHVSLSGLLYQVYAYPTRYIADFFFGCSKEAGIARFGKKICNSNKFLVLNNAIDVTHFSFDVEVRNIMRNRLNVNGRIVIGHVGRFCDQKNHTFLINVFAQIHKKKKNTMLLLVGDGVLKETIEKQVKEAGLEDSVIFAGVQNDVSVYYQAMDVFVFPSLYEGLPLSILEVQANGLPCVISERVPLECKIVDDLVNVCSLSDSADIWAQKILCEAERVRMDCTHKLKEKEYDIFDAVKRLENFYIRQVGEYIG